MSSLSEDTVANIVITAIISFAILIVTGLVYFSDRISNVVFYHDVSFLKAQFETPETTAMVKKNQISMVESAFFNRLMEMPRYTLCVRSEISIINDSTSDDCRMLHGELDLRAKEETIDFRVYFDESGEITSIYLGKDPSEVEPKELIESMKVNIEYGVSEFNTVARYEEKLNNEWEEYKKGNAGK